MANRVILSIFDPVLIIAALNSEADGTNPSSGFGAPDGYQPSMKYCLINARAPEIAGVDIDVPLFLTNVSNETSFVLVEL